MVNTLPAPSHLGPGTHPPLGTRDYLALALFASSLLFEVVADAQKSACRRAKDAKRHEERFITRGLWGVSRHPKCVLLSLERDTRVY